MITRPRAFLLAACLLLGSQTAGGALGQTAEDAEDRPQPGLNLPPGLEIEWLGTLTQIEGGGVEFTGPVTLTWRDSRLQADRLSLHDRRYVEAEGNVLIVWGQNRIFGRRMTYDLEEERGVFEDAIGHTLDEYLFRAKFVEKIGERKLRLKSAVVTTCTQPNPYWSFAVSSATITIDKYARMKNVRFRTGHAPLIYLPYLVWPVKEGRAAGLLMPEFSSTEARGRVYSQELFIPLGRSADLTLLGRYYTEAGFGGGGEVRFIPNARGAGIVGGFFIDDKVAAMQRYRGNYKQTQEFQNGFRMVADVEVVSDSNYYTDFERDLNTSSSPQTLARLEFSRNGAWASMNVRELRREQLSTGLVQQTLPEVEWRGRSRRLGKTPFYLSFESSMASIQQRGSSIDADYLRGDVAPEISIPYSPSSWFDITPRARYRWTYYTQSLDMDLVSDESLTRRLWSYGVDFVGPKAFGIFGRKAGRQYKHTIEPRVSYGYGESFERIDDILGYDEIDRINGAGKQANYAIVQRLFAKRPKKLGTAPPTSAEVIVLPDGTTHDPSSAGDATTPEAPEEEGEASDVPVEIASLEINQSRSFDDNISSADLDEDGVIESFSRSSPIRLVGRFNPTRDLSLDLRGTYDILFRNIDEVSLSGTARGTLASMRFSVVHRNGLGVDSNLVPVEDSTQVRLTAGLNLLRERLQFKVDGSYNAQPLPEQSRFPDQRFQLQYSTQCCTFLVERLTRDFGTPQDRRELYFRIDLRGVGKLLTQTF